MSQPQKTCEHVFEWVEANRKLRKDRIILGDARQYGHYVCLVYYIIETGTCKNCGFREQRSHEVDGPTHYWEHADHLEGGRAREMSLALTVGFEAMRSLRSICAALDRKLGIHESKY